MQQKKSQNSLFHFKSGPAGEPFVWFSAMGLSLGILMILFLLGVILIYGTEVFWPKDITLLKLKPESEAVISNSTLLAGAVIKEQEKIVQTLSPEGKALVGSQEEWQLFLGNKDLYGFSFKFVDVQDIEEVSYPKNLMRIERLEYGDAIGIPVALKLQGGLILSAQDNQFQKKLHSLLREVKERRVQIKKIEKDEIGAINYKMTQLKYELKALESSGSSQKVAEVNHQIANLQQRYEILASQARELRGLQQKNIFVYQTVTGQEKHLTTGEMVDFYYPNRLNVFQKTGMMFHKMGRFLIEDPREANTEGGVFPAIFGTFVMTVLMSIAVVPFGVIAAIYLREYAKQGMLVRAVRVAVNNLAGVPSIVFGVFGLGFFVYFVGTGIDHFFFHERLPTPTFGTGGILWASLTLALLTVPVVIVATEEAIAAVPRGMREGSLACGASKWQTIKNIVLPASAPGILTGLILAMARGASEVAPLMIVGVVKLAPNLPVDGLFPFFHLERKFMHLGFHIYDLGFQSPDSEAAKPMVFATTLLLISLVVILNMGAIFIRERLRKKYATGAF